MAHVFIITWVITIALTSDTESTRPPFSCDSLSPYPFCNLSLPIAQRAYDVVSRLTLDEKILQLVDGAPAIPRLGIAAYEWWSEAIHGVSGYGKGFTFDGAVNASTQFPQVILTAASFDSQLWYRIGQTIGREARAMYNEGQASGLTFWTPTINVFRDPRWGRGQETPGEDPLIVGKYSVSYVRGIQGDSFEGGKLNLNDLQASACCKHFVANDLDHWKNVTRFDFNAIITPQDLEDTYLPPFRSCVQQGQATGIMCAFNRVNGVPNCANYDLLTNKARKAWGFNGYITSDCDGLVIMHDVLGYSPVDTVSATLRAGMDVNCGSYLKNFTKLAIDQKKLTESEVDTALKNLFSIRMRLGLFNGDPRSGTYGHLRADQVCSKEHQDLALEVARDGIVLLKNSVDILPLSKTKTTSLAVIGPNANVTQTLLGNYEGVACRSVTVLRALQGYVKNTYFEQGCVDSVNCTSVATDEAVAIAKVADYVILVMGLDQSQEREDFDRVNLVLPGEQESLISTVARAAKKQVVLVLLCGGPVDVSFAKDDPKIGSILWAGYPGEAGGIALANVIFGDHNPGGRLPMTWYPKEFANVPMTDMRMRPDPSSGYPGRTYRFYNSKTIFEFGYGLSYSNVSYKFISSTPNKINLHSNQAKISKSARYVSVSETETDLCDNAKFNVVVGVENHGQMVSKHAVLLFAKREGHFIKQLVGFKKVSLEGRGRGEVEFVVKACEHLSSANKDGLMVIAKGPHLLLVGDKEHPIDIY